MNGKIIQTIAKLYFMMKQTIKEKGYMLLSPKEYRILISMKRVLKLMEAVAGKSSGKLKWLKRAYIWIIFFYHLLSNYLQSISSIIIFEGGKDIGVLEKCCVETRTSLIPTIGDGYLELY